MRKREGGGGKKERERGGRKGERRGRKGERGGRKGERGGRKGERGGRKGERGGRKGERGGRKGERRGRKGERGGRKGERGGRKGERGGRKGERGGRKGKKAIHTSHPFGTPGLQTQIMHPARRVLDCSTNPKLVCVLGLSTTTSWIPEVSGHRRLALPWQQDLQNRACAQIPNSLRTPLRPQQTPQSRRTWGRTSQGGAAFS